MNKKCLFCKGSVPKIALAFSNSVAIEQGYCCFMCMVGFLGDEAYQVLEKQAKENQISRGKP